MANSILVTGSAGFIGFHVSKKLLKMGFKVIGIDNFDDYYSTKLKKDRNKILKSFENYSFHEIDLKNIIKLKVHDVKLILHLAAQPGITLSEQNRKKYMESNIVNTFLLSEFMILNKITKIVYASSSSVYSGNKKNINSENSQLKIEKNFYATTKKITETIISYYSNKKISSIGIRYFTVYGQYGRPDMLMHKIMSSYKDNLILNLFNKGENERDFTFVDDAVEATLKIIFYLIKSKVIFSDIYNIGFNKPVKVKKIVSLFEKKLNYSFKKNFLTANKYESFTSKSNNSKFTNKFGKIYTTSIEEGVNQFIDWYKYYYKIS